EEVGLKTEQIQTSVQYKIHNYCFSPTVSHQFTLDLNTAHNLIYLSDWNEEVSFTSKLQPYPDHPDRFDVYPQVLCRESVSGRCYWEVESVGVNISVSYKSISRKGSGYECFFGYNDQSWISHSGTTTKRLNSL
ncbi:hypothetical protein M9458_037747, partial [Cirrhinus mrigala]